jgi:protein tyrosine/serine phosphatase
LISRGHYVRKNKRQQNLRKAIILGISAALITAGGFVWYHKTRPYHFRVITPGVLYRSGWMKPHNFEKIINKYHIRTVVNLCLQSEDTFIKNCEDEQHICKANNVKLVHLPLPANTPPDDEQLLQWLNLLKDPKRLPVLVHCAQGATRTSVMVAIYEMEFLGKRNRETLEGLDTFGHEMNEPKRKAICDFILNYNRQKTNSNNKGT